MRSGLISERNNSPARDAGTEAHAGGLHRTAALVRHLKTAAGRLRGSISDPEAAEAALTDLGAREARQRGWNVTYTMTKWDYCFDMSETLALAERLSAEEKNRYPVDPADYEWEHYIRRIHLPGLNRYGLRQEKPPRPEPELDLTELDVSAAG